MTHSCLKRNKARQWICLESEYRDTTALFVNVWFVCRGEDHHSAGAAQQNPAQAFGGFVQQQLFSHHGCQ